MKSEMIQSVDKQKNKLLNIFNTMSSLIETK